MLCLPNSYTFLTTRTWVWKFCRCWFHFAAAVAVSVRACLTSVIPSQIGILIVSTLQFTATKTPPTPLTKPNTNSPSNSPPHLSLHLIQIHHHFHTNSTSLFWKISSLVCKFLLLSLSAWDEEINVFRVGTVPQSIVRWVREKVVGDFGKECMAITATVESEWWAVALAMWEFRRGVSAPSIERCFQRASRSFFSRPILGGGWCRWVGGRCGTCRLGGGDD